MRDANYIKGQLKSWRACKNWIEEKYPEKKFLLEHKLKNLKAISYEEHLGGNLDESLRRSKINDELKELEKQREYCQSVIDFCEEIILKVKPRYRDIVRYKHSTYATDGWISSKTGYAEESIRKICSRETNRIINS